MHVWQSTGETIGTVAEAEMKPVTETGIALDRSGEGYAWSEVLLKSAVGVVHDCGCYSNSWYNYRSTGLTYESDVMM